MKSSHNHSTAFVLAVAILVWLCGCSQERTSYSVRIPQNGTAIVVYDRERRLQELIYDDAELKKSFRVEFGYSKDGLAKVTVFDGDQKLQETRFAAGTETASSSGVITYRSTSRSTTKGIVETREWQIAGKYVLYKETHAFDSQGKSVSSSFYGPHEVPLTNSLYKTP